MRPNLGSRESRVFCSACITLLFRVSEAKKVLKPASKKLLDVDGSRQRELRLISQSSAVKTRKSMVRGKGTAPNATSIFSLLGHYDVER